MAWLQVYAVGLYVEAEKAASELAVRSRGGFFGDDRCAQWAAREGVAPIMLMLALPAGSGHSLSDSIVLLAP